jgi:hypothetical protein
MYLKAIDKKVGLLINFNTKRLKAGIKGRILQEDTEGREKTSKPVGS